MSYRNGTEQLSIRPGTSGTFLDDGSLELTSSDQKLKVSGVGSEIWKLLAAGKSEAEIIEILLRMYEVGRSQLEQDIHQFINMLNEELVLTREEIDQSLFITGVTPRELLAADAPWADDALEDALGDSYLCAHNSVYKLIRQRALSLGYRFVSDNNDPLPACYAMFSLSCLGQILRTRVVPYFKTRSPLERLEREQPSRSLPLRFLRSNLKSNYTLHESSHGIAHEILTQDSIIIHAADGSSALSGVLIALLEEAFANTVERLASFEATSLIHQTFFGWNSYMSSDAGDRAVLEKAHDRLGRELSFDLLFLAHLIANLYAEEPPKELTSGLLDCFEVENTATSRNLTRMALNLNLAFRSETNPSYFQMLGLRREYEQLCGWPIQRHLELVTKLRPLAVQLYAVLTPDMGRQPDGHGAATILAAAAHGSNSHTDAISLFQPQHEERVS